MSAAAISPNALLADRRIVVCVGCGGVGKTTTAAAIALQAARQGMSALVLTIDPARRLADALGMGALDNTPRRLPDGLRDVLGIPEAGQLFAMMLDMKGTFDDLVERLASSEEMRRRIFANPIYQHVSDALAGSAEYAAMEKVYEMAGDHRFDLIVLDTPPSQHALDFLDAPRRLLEFLDSRLVRLLVHPTFSAGRFGLKLFQGTTHRALKLVERVSGIGFLEDISAFLLAFEDMSEGFSQRARSVQSMLLGETTGFVLVAAPSTEAAHDASRFLDRLQRGGVPLAGIAVNRTHGWPGHGPPPDLPAPAEPGSMPAPESEAVERDLDRLADALRDDMPDALAAEGARAAYESARRYATVVRVDESNVAPLRARAAASGLFLRCIPELRSDVHDLVGLAAIADHLFATAPPAEGAQEEARIG